MNNINDSLLGQHGQQSLSIFFHKAKTQQAACFRAIDNKCTLLSDSICYLQKTVSYLEHRLKQQSQNSNSSKLWQLRDKQKQFIIAELESKIKRIQASQQSSQYLLLQKQSSVLDLQYKCEQLRQQNQEMKQELTKKTKQIKQLIKSNSTLKIIKQVPNTSRLATSNEPKLTATLSLSELGTKKQQIEIQNQHYEQLESKLKQMQDCLNEEIEQYKKKNVKLQQQIQHLKLQVKKQSENTKRIYELQLKIKNMSVQNKELQQSYTIQVAQNNDNQVKFHKKINQLKMQIQQAKKVNKNIGKDTEKMLRKLSATVLGSNDKSSIFIGTSTINQQFEQLAKQILKCQKKEINAVVYEKDAIIEELRINLEGSRSKVKELSGTVQRLKISKSERKQKSPVLNGHSISNKSTSKTDVQNRQKQKINQKLQKSEQKYQQKLQQLRNQIEQRQKQLNLLRIKNDEYSTEMSKKNLQLQAKLAQSEMQYSYQQQKLTQLTKNTKETEKNMKQQYDREIEKMKSKIKDVQCQKQQMRNKNKEVEEKLFAKDRDIKDGEKKLKQLQEKIKRLQKKHESKISEYKSSIESKDKTIEDLISKNQNLLTQAKIVKEKNRLLQNNVATLKSINSNVQTQSMQQAKQKLQNQYILQKQLLEEQIARKNEKIEQLTVQLQEKLEQINKKEEKISELTVHGNKQQNQIKVLKNENENLKQSSQKLKQSNEKANNFGQLKQQYQKREKLLKTEGQKIISQLKSSKKELQAELKKVTEEKAILKQEISKLKQQVNSFEQQKMKSNSEKFRDSERERKVVKQYEQKISQLSSKVTELQKSLQKVSSLPPSPPKNQKQIAKLKGTDSVEYVQFGIGTDKKQTTCYGMNTVDIFALQTQQNGIMNKILDLNDDQDHMQNNRSQGRDEAMKNSNLFINLDNGNPVADDVFQICDEDQQVNFGQSSLNLQIRQLFTSLRIQIEKILNQEEISFGITKLLPQALQDDYYQLMGYIKEKIAQIKVHNEISFIMAQAGNEPQRALDQSLTLPQNFLERRASQGGAQNLRKVLEQKQALIHSLMNQRTDQQNTINQLTQQKQQIQEQNQNRFMNQCNVYKKQIKEHKKSIDMLQMNNQCYKNIIRNILEAYSENQDMEDDFRQSMTMYAKIGKLNQKERTRINWYIDRYLQAKGLA